MDFSSPLHWVCRAGVHGWNGYWIQHDLNIVLFSGHLLRKDFKKTLLQNVLKIKVRSEDTSRTLWGDYTCFKDVCFGLTESYVSAKKPTDQLQLGSVFLGLYKVMFYRFGLKGLFGIPRF